MRPEGGRFSNLTIKQQGYTTLMSLYYVFDLAANQNTQLTNKEKKICHFINNCHPDDISHEQLKGFFSRPTEVLPIDCNLYKKKVGNWQIHWYPTDRGYNSDKFNYWVCESVGGVSNASHGGTYPP